MKKVYIAIYLVIVGLFAAPSIAGAYNERGITGVEYTTRTQRGADETRTYSSRQEYKDILQRVADHADDEPTQAQKNQQTATEYILDAFNKEFSVAKVLRTEADNSLFRPLQYAKQKTKLIVHHTATSGILPKTIAEEKTFMKDLYKFHAFTRGRGDIGYNFIIMPSGRIYEGRKGGAGVIGAHATWNNTPSVGVSLVGNFDAIEPEQGQVSSLLNILTSLSKKFSIDPLKQSYYFKSSTKFPYITTQKNYAIAGHTDAGSTACPGENLYNLLGAIRQVVSDRLASNPTKTVTVQHSGAVLAFGTSLQALKTSYSNSIGFTPSKAKITRLSKAPLVKDTATIQQSIVRVLLYDASTTRDIRTLTCSDMCSVRIGNVTRLTPSLVVSKTKTGFSLMIANKKYVAEKFAVQVGTAGTVSITDYNRIASNKTPLNVFRQTLLFVTAPLQKIDGTASTTQQVINMVSFDNYMRGVAEASDQEAQTKTNVLALLSKGYAMYYVGGSFSHPNVPAGALYNAIDDPRLFQKYLGQGRENISKNWPKALDAMKNTYISYNGVLPILPYFHCSAGFTWSATEKRGRIDTSYLQSVIDPAGKCDSGDFEGHGVGLSGKGAAAMALSGKSESEIIQYYYPGVAVSSSK